MAEWSRVLNTTIHKYIRDREDNVMRNRKLLAMLKSRGRVTFNESGDLLDWKVRFKRSPMQGFADSDTLTFPRKDRHKTAQIDWRGYAATDSMTKRERLMNKNTEAIIKTYSEIATMLMDDMEDQFSDELYIDGNATGNTKRIHGLESFLGAGSPASAGYIAAPSDTYAGLTTGLGDYGGSWSVNGSSQVEWPTGTGDAHYDFWSPTLVDYTDTAWAASTKTWPNTCREALRYAIVKSRKNKSKRGQVDVTFLENELYRQFEEKLEANERLVIQRGEEDGLYKLGFKDVINFEGCDITSEYGVPSLTGYGLCMDACELRSLQGQLFVAEGPDVDISTQSSRFSIDFYGNMRFNPRNFFKLKNYT